MILIFSQNFEPSTCHVIDWIDYYGGEFIRLNGDDDLMTHLELNISNAGSDCLLTYKARTFLLSQISSLWYRRGGLPPVERKTDKIKDIFPSGFFIPALNMLEEEVFVLYDYLYFLISRIRNKIGDRNRCSLNKLTALKLAAEVGFQIPSTIVTNKKNALLRFYKDLPSLITKSISGAMLLKDRAKTGHFFAYTEKLDELHLKSLSQEFFPSKFQRNIEKHLELRIFYLFGKTYPMAIFSQADPQTAIDFRKYNRDKPNRTVPFKLPQDIDNQIHQLMERLELECGSLDLILTKSGQYVFLEVNPVGQFGMVSEPCNYYLEREIAKHLTTVK